MSIVLLKILGTLTVTLIGVVIGSVGGILMSYVISKIVHGAVFNYRFAIANGIFWGACGFVSSIRQLWLR
jgi:hypothetical protein